LLLVLTWKILFHYRGSIVPQEEKDGSWLRFYQHSSTESEI